MIRQSLSLFLAQAIRDKKKNHLGVGRATIRIATIGVTAGVAIMVITLSVIQGFKHTISEKVTGFGGNIIVENFSVLQGENNLPICLNDSVISLIQNTEGIKHVERYATTQGILKTEEDFLGITFKGISKEYDLTFLEKNIVEGQITRFNDEEKSMRLLISRNTANKLLLSCGDKVRAYFISKDGVRTRQFVVEGIFETNLSQFDNNLCFTDLNTIRRLNAWEEEQCSGAQLYTTSPDKASILAQTINKKLAKLTDQHDNAYITRSVQEAYPQIFSWLELLDINVWIILLLMICLACFTMSSGLLIIILERTNTIGILKAIGANNKTIQKTFLWYAAFITVKGIIMGDILSIALILTQKYTGFITLDPASYYVSTAPLELNITLILAISVATLAICTIVMIIPSLFISKISPAKSMRYE